VFDIGANVGLVEDEISRHNLFKHYIYILIVKWRQTGNHLVQENAKTVDVDFAVVAVS